MTKKSKNNAKKNDFSTKITHFDNKERRQDRVERWLFASDTFR